MNKIQTEEKVRTMCRYLHEAYGSPKWNNKDDPFDEILYIILSAKTHYTKFNLTYYNFKDQYVNYSAAADAPANDIFESIKIGGLGEVKAKQIKSILQKIQTDNPKFDRRIFDRMKNDKLETYLKTLPGIGTKSAKCVMMYSLGRKVLPVDIHNYRITKRVGLIGVDVPFKKAEKIIEDIVPHNLRYKYHVNAVALGKDCCRKSRVYCDRCPIEKCCDKVIKFY